MRKQRIEVSTQDEMAVMFKKRRQQLGLSQQALARLMGVGKARVSLLESGSPHFGVMTMYQWANALGLTVTFLVEGFGVKDGK